RLQPGVEPPEPPAERPRPGGPDHARERRGTTDERVRSGLGSRSQGRRVGIARLEVAEEVGSAAEALREDGPADRVAAPAGAAGRRQAPEGEPGALVRDPLQHLVRVRLDPAEGQVDTVAARVEHPEDRVERPHRGRVLDDEEDPHACAVGPSEQVFDPPCSGTKRWYQRPFRSPEDGSRPPPTRGGRNRPAGRDRAPPWPQAAWVRGRPAPHPRAALRLRSIIYADRR